MKILKTSVRFLDCLACLTVSFLHLANGIGIRHVAVRNRAREILYGKANTFQRLPRLLVKHIANNAARHLNYFPSKSGISQHYSPRMIMHQNVLDYEKHCKIALGTYVQANTEPNPKNQAHPRTLDCIYLRPTANHRP